MQSFQLRRGLLLAALLTGPVLIVGVVGALVPNPATHVVTLVILAASLVLSSRFFPEKRPGIFVCFMLGLSSLIAASLWAPAAVLHGRGERAAVVVTSVHGFTRFRWYGVSGPDGPVHRPLFDAKTTTYPIGERVDVVVDPDGLLATATVSDVDREPELWAATAILLGLTISCSLVVGGRRRRATTADIERVSRG